MAKKKEISKPKPPEILELERVWGVVFYDSETIDHMSHFESHSYSVGSRNEIIGISITNSEIDDITPLSKIQRLISLHLGITKLTDISPLSFHKNLQHLSLQAYNIDDISPIRRCKKLVSLNISNNITSSLDFIQGLNNLESLSFYYSHVSDISFISGLNKLKEIYGAGNNINDISILSSLTQLEVISLPQNQIHDISPIINLKKLGVITFSDNQIKIIPKEIAKKYNWLEGGLSTEYEIGAEAILYNNPFEYPPTSVIELGSETVKNYYEASEQFGYAPLSEGRIIVVGDGSAGKSSLIERVLYDSFEQGKTQTNGIKIEHLHLPHPDDKRDLTFHIWDFGGQEIQHAVHKFFFTEGCLYVLVLDNRKEEEPEYWLQQIESLGGKAPVIVVFNKQDDNATEIADRKFLREKYPNIVGFYNTSCKSGAGIDEFKTKLEQQVVKLKTVNEQFPNNWFKIKKAIEESTSSEQHYLTYETYQAICKNNNTESDVTQKLLLRYFNTIGAVTWFGEDTYLKFLHVLSPQWITQGVYKIITAKKTARLFGQLHIADFKELLQPINEEDYTYDENHYGYILSMMKKFDLCYTSNDKDISIPSAFGKEPKVEYSDFKGGHVRTYILQFKDYMPPAIIHRFIAQNLANTFQNNFWYSGIVYQDSKSNSLAMVHADKEAKRIYVRIKGDSQLGNWEYIRRRFDEIAKSYANINYNELVALDETNEATVDYEDLMGFLKSGEGRYFHPKLKKAFSVGYLLGLFETKEKTIGEFEKSLDGMLSEYRTESQRYSNKEIVLQILNNNNPTITTNVNTEINVDFNVNIVNTFSSNIRGDADYLLEELKDSNKEISEALKKIIAFAEDAKSAKSSSDVVANGWGRKLKGVIKTLSGAGESLKNITDGGEALKSIFEGMQKLTQELNLAEIADYIASIPLQL